MPSRVRLVAIDIDGTLLPTSSITISHRNRRALCEAQQAGLHVVIATGRRHQYARPVLEQIGLSPRTVMISSNGSVLRHFDGELISRIQLPAASARALCGALRGLGGAVVFTFDREYGPTLVVESVESLHDRIAAWVQANRTDIMQVAPLERAFDHGETPIQGMLCGTVAEVRAAQESLESSPVAPDITMHRTEYAERNLGILDLLPPRCSKAHALDDYARSLGLTAANVMAIGDNFNDQAMLEYAGYPVLMGNAGVELQALASHHGWAVTDSNDDDGVAAVIEPLLSLTRTRTLPGNEGMSPEPDLGSEVVPTGPVSDAP